MTARFRTFARGLQHFGASEATVEIDRRTQIVSVRMLRRRRVYSLPLSWVAEAIAWRVSRAEASAKRAEKRKARHG